MLNSSFSRHFSVWQHCVFFGALQHIHLHCTQQPIQPTLHQCSSSPLTLAKKTFTLCLCFVTKPSSVSSQTSSTFGPSSMPPASSSLPDSFRLLQWNVEGLRTKGVERLHFLLLFPVDLICIQKSNIENLFLVHRYEICL